MTHSFQSAHGEWEVNSLKVQPGEPLPTGYGVDLCEKIFGERVAVSSRPE